MASTTFSGPIKAGTIANTTGTTVGDDVKNVGFVKMAQTAAWTQSTTAADTGIVIPANSQIVDVQIYITTATTALLQTILQQTPRTTTPPLCHSPSPRHRQQQKQQQQQQQQQ